MLTRAEQGLVDASHLGELGQPMRDVALSLVHTGWPVFPCGQDKAPLVPGGFKARTKNIQQVEQWWALHPDAMPAICPGDNELAALDVDSAGAWLRTEQVGISALRGLIVESGGTSEPFQTADGVLRTPRHVYVRTGAAPAMQGVVVRFLAGYVIAPGARRLASKRMYQVTSAEEPATWKGYVTVQRLLPDVAQPALATARIERVRELVAAIPNPLENGREPYLAMAHMIHGALGDLGRDIFLEWAGKWPGKVNRAEDERVWDTLPPSQLGFTDLWVLASRHGVDTSGEQKEAAQGDFDILGPTPAPEPEQPKQQLWFTGRQLLSQPELLAEPTPAVPFLAWPGRKTLFAGREKAGKSTLAFAAISAVTRGDDFLGKETTQQRVLWLTEESLGDVARRIKEMRTEQDHIAVLQIMQTPWSDLAIAFREFAPQIVVIDSLSWFAGLGEEQENSAGSWIPIFRNFDKLTRAGVALLLLHHSAKYSETGEYRGSTGIGANVDVIVQMKKPAEGSALRSMIAKGRMNLAKAFDVRLLDPKTGDFKLTQGIEEMREQSLEEAIAAYLFTHPGSSVTSLMEAVQKRREAVVEAIARLKKLDRVEQVGKGWSLRPDFEPVEVV